LDPLADLLVLREKDRDAQVSFRQMTAEVHDPALRDEARQSVDQFGRQVTAFHGKVRELIASNPDTDQRHRILTSIPGVGPVSVAGCPSSGTSATARRPRSAPQCTTPTRSASSCGSSPPACRDPRPTGHHDRTGGQNRHGFPTDPFGTECTLCS
jgi:hypothetical protein